jgi:glycosyltransferase involved in cell wall biosynthesis
MRYVVVVQAPAWPVSHGVFALDSAFAAHLRELKMQVGSAFEELVLIGPSMTQAQYEALRPQMVELDAQASGIRFLPAFPLDVPRWKFLLTGWWPMWRMLNREFSGPCVVHSGMSTDLARPLMFMASLAGWWRKRPVVFFVDMDFREHARRFRETGAWGLRSYVLNRAVYDPLKWIQLWMAPRLFDLCCFKSPALVRSFGKGRPNVKSFFDTAHSASQVVSEEALAERLSRISDPARGLVACYFGRLAMNKGVDRMIEAVRVARKAGADVRLRIIGDGECRDALRQQVEREGLGYAVDFINAVSYGEPLFSLLADCDVCLAAPIVEDTPRAAFDAMARGLPVIAFDISYFRELAMSGGSVVTTPWPHAQGMASALVDLSTDRMRLASLVRKAVVFARANTQEIWLSRRHAWLQALLRSRSQ